MKSKYPFLLAFIFAMPAMAQPVQPGVVEKTVTETVSPGGKRVVEETVVTKPVFEPARQLAILPHALAIETAPVVPGKTVETTETVTRVGGRVYNTDRSVVVVEGRELPYVTVPVLFVKETAELLDSESRVALSQTAAAILEVIKTTPTATFDIEGHTSTDGADEMNLNLSAQRAQRIFDELTHRYAVPAAFLTAHGYGEMYPKYPNGSEEQMTLDRRVLVVRVK